MNRSSANRIRQGRAVSLWLADEDVEALKAIAHDKGIGHTTLIRMWVREKLKELKRQEQAR